MDNYERLEFLGDALLNITISKWLYNRYPNYNEGKLTKKRSELVNKKFLLIISKKIFKTDDIIISKSIQKNNEKTIDNIFSDIIESIIGAIFIDSNINNVENFIKRHLLSNLLDSETSNINYKGMLIERCHKLNYKEPLFELIKLKNGNQIKFQATTTINKTLYIGLGNTKKNAQIDAAKKALLEV